MATTGRTATRPIVVGTYARLLRPDELSSRRNRNESATHVWQVAVRSPTNDDLSNVVKKIVVYLHQSFANPTRTLEKPPYEFEETGWGEFELTLKFYFVDSSEKPAEMRHWLRLYADTSAPQQPGEYVVHETHDELIFRNPSDRMADALAYRLPGVTAPYAMQHLFKVEGKRDRARALLAAAQQVVARETERVQETVSDLTFEVERIKELYFTTSEDKAQQIMAESSEIKIT